MKTFVKNMEKLILLAAFAIPLAANAQTVPGGPGSGACPGCGHARSRGHRLYDPKTVTTVQGEVTDLQRFNRGRGHEGIVLTVTVGSETLPVHLGPDFYVDQQSLKLAKGDRIEVKGSRITFKGNPAIIAQEVRRGDEVLTLRDANGIPLWSRRYGGSGPRP